jgi:hypothetical protein
VSVAEYEAAMAAERGRRIYQREQEERQAMGSATVKRCVEAWRAVPPHDRRDLVVQPMAARAAKMRRMGGGNAIEIAALAAAIELLEALEREP